MRQLFAPNVYTKFGCSFIRILKCQPVCHESCLSGIMSQNVRQSPAEVSDILESLKAQQLKQIAQIRSTKKFKTYKIVLSAIAVFLAIFYCACIHFMGFIGLITENKKFIIIFLLFCLFSLINIVGLFAIICEHLILILIYDIITKVTLIIPNPVTCVQCILLNSYIKELDKIHKLKHKK